MAASREFYDRKFKSFLHLGMPLLQSSDAFTASRARLLPFPNVKNTTGSRVSVSVAETDCLICSVRSLCRSQAAHARIMEQKLARDSRLPDLNIEGPSPLQGTQLRSRRAGAAAATTPQELGPAAHVGRPRNG